MRYAVLGALFVIEFVFSLNMNCTNPTTACPNAVQWSARSNSFNCSGNKRYVCLMAWKTELREGCIFDSKIPAGRIGCPYTKQCDKRTNQPLLVTENKYLSCPPELNGCPPRNHSGYSILNIYKYPRCQGKNISDESSVSPNKTSHAALVIPPARIPRDGNWTLIIICIILGVIIVSVTAFIFNFRDEIDDWLKNLNTVASSQIYVLGNERLITRTMEGYSGDKDTKDVNFKTRDKKNNPGKERTELQLPTRQQSYQVKQDTSQTPSPDVVIETEHQGNNKGFVLSRDLDAGNVDISTIVVTSLYGNCVLSDPRQNNSGTERAEFHPSARQLSYQINQETSQRSPPDVTTEAEDQDNIENMNGCRASRIRDMQEVLRSSRNSCSSSDSDRSQTPMFKRSQTKRQHLNIPLSPKRSSKDCSCRSYLENK